MRPWLFLIIAISLSSSATVVSAEALEAKFIANCIYGGWDADRTHSALALLRALRTAPWVDLSELRG